MGEKNSNTTKDVEAKVQFYCWDVCMETMKLLLTPWGFCHRGVYEKNLYP